MRKLPTNIMKNRPGVQSTENAQTALNWNDPGADQYERTIPLKIPGYALLYDLTERLLSASLEAGAHMARQQPAGTAETVGEQPDSMEDKVDVATGGAETPGGSPLSRRLLIVGAGGGQELAVLGSRHPHWTFAGVDPSQPMLEAARRRMEREGLAGRVELVAGEVGSLTDCGRFDAATCMLVLHFVRGNDAKRELLRSIADRLVPGAPLFLAAICGKPGSAAFGLQMAGWRNHMLAAGIAAAEWERFAASVGGQSDPVSAQELEQLLAETGFGEMGRFFGSFLIEGMFAIKRKEEAEHER